MKMLIDDLKIDTIVAGFNGGVFVKPDLTVIQSRFISRAAAARALEVIGQQKLVACLRSAGGASRRAFIQPASVQINRQQYLDPKLLIRPSRFDLI
jgi:hydroxymethylpyrimidine pyrophosphatase-like HAD family hydrolase